MTKADDDRLPSERHAADTVRRYHERTKHHLRRYANGPATIAWDRQPDPFRRYAGTTLVPLALVADSVQTTYGDLYLSDAVHPATLDTNGLAALLEMSMGLSAWKQYGADRWALRCNPSSGNLHPTEAYVVTAEVPALPAGVYHYASRDHVLERRCAFEADPALAGGGVLLGLSSIFWREAWKYGERAFRYCQHDVGHALAAVRYAAATLGWSARLLDDWGDDQLAALLGLDRPADFEGAEAEHPDLLCLIGTQPSAAPDNIDPAPLLTLARGGVWHGRANTLDPQPTYRWPVIDDVAAATAKPRTRAHLWRPPPRPAVPDIDAGLTAARLIRQRRSAQAFDGVTAITVETLYRMLDCLLPRAGLPPWDLFAEAPRIHPILSVHRVQGLAPGLYALPRREDSKAALQRAMREEFAWTRPEGCPDHLPFYHLVGANGHNAATNISCHQAIAGDSAFSLGMLAEFDTTLDDTPWRYRSLHWEAGVLGQVLYLEAEAAGVRGTGIGCFFDDAFHELLGLRSTDFQDLYHFTVGGPVTDHRLISLPPYGHLQR